LKIFQEFKKKFLSNFQKKFFQKFKKKFSVIFKIFFGKMDTGPDTQANSSYLPFWFLPNEMDPGYPGRVYLYENQPSKTSILNYLWLNICAFPPPLGSRSPSSYMTLQSPISSDFSYIWVKFHILFLSEYSNVQYLSLTLDPLLWG